MGNRPSALDLTFLCPLAGQSETTTRAALMGSAYHALASGLDAAAWLARLTDRERAEVLARPMPVDVVLSDGTALLWSEAHHETRVGLTRELAWCDPSEAWCAGTADAWWSAGGCIYVADLKSSGWTNSPNSLQLAAYGYALAAREGAECYSPGIWAADAASWKWGERVYPGSPEAWWLEDRLRHAVENVSGPPCVGPHCDRCYRRLRCEAWTLPGLEAVADLAVLAAPEALEHARAAELVRLRSRASAVIETLDATLRAYAREHGGITDPATGEVWRPVAMPGRESCDTDALKRDLGEDAARYFRRGDGYEVFRWTKPAKAKKEKLR